MKRLGILIVALAAAAPALAVQGGTGPILLRAKGPISTKVVAGKPLPANVRLTLQQGDVLMLLDGKGVRTLAGPGTFQNGAYTRTGPRMGTGGQRIGAVRGASGSSAASLQPDAGAQQWVVPLSDIATICLPANRALALWKRAGAAFTIEVQPAASGTPRSITWPAAAAQIAWPRDLSTAPGARYRLSSQALGGTREVEFRSLSADDPACAPQIDFNIQLAAESEQPAVSEYLN